MIARQRCAASTHASTHRTASTNTNGGLVSLVMDAAAISTAMSHGGASRSTAQIASSTTKAASASPNALVSYHSNGLASSDATMTSAHITDAVRRTTNQASTTVASTANASTNTSTRSVKSCDAPTARRAVAGMYCMSGHWPTYFGPWATVSQRVKRWLLRQSTTPCAPRVRPAVSPCRSGCASATNMSMPSSTTTNTSAVIMALGAGDTRPSRSRTNDDATRAATR